MKNKIIYNTKMQGVIKFSYISEYFSNKDTSKIRKVLDIGGRDYSYKIFSEIFPNSEVILLNCEKKDIKGCKNAICGDAQDLSIFPKERMDVILSLDVIEHLTDPDVHLENVKNKLLRDTDVFILSTPNMSMIYNRLALFFGYGLFNYSPSNRFRLSILGRNLTYHLSEHKSVFTLKQMCQLLDIHGFKIEKIVGFSYAIPNDHSIMSKLKNLINFIVPLSLKEGHIFFLHKM